MIYEEIYQKINKKIKELENKYKSLKIKNEIIEEELKELKNIEKFIKNKNALIKFYRKLIDKKLKTKEFSFLSQHFDLSYEEMLPEKRASYEDFKLFLETKKYNVLPWDEFLEPWRNYYLTLNEIMEKDKEAELKFKLIEYYLSHLK
jgi:predicted RNase H-like nuclease (RuvC/YqgF family)